MIYVQEQRKKKRSCNHFPCSSRTACKTRPPILFLKSTKGACLWVWRETERSEPGSSCRRRPGCSEACCLTLSCLQLCHNGPRLSQVLLSLPIVSGHADMQFTWQCVIMTFSPRPEPVIFTHMEAVWSLTVLETSAAHATWSTAAQVYFSSNGA